MTTSKLDSTLRARWLPILVGLVFVVGVGSVVVKRSWGHGSTPENPRLRDVKRAAAAVSKCDEALGTAGSGDAAKWQGMRHARSIWCGKPQGLEALLTWNQFRSQWARRVALSISPSRKVPTCSTATEIFVLAFTSDEANAEFCRRVGASAPVGRAMF